MCWLPCAGIPRIDSLFALWRARRWSFQRSPEVCHCCNWSAGVLPPLRLVGLYGRRGFEWCIAQCTKQYVHLRWDEQCLHLDYNIMFLLARVPFRDWVCMPLVITDTVLLHYSLLLVQRTITLPWGIHAYVWRPVSQNHRMAWFVRNLKSSNSNLSAVGSFLLFKRDYLPTVAYEGTQLTPC